MSKTAKNVRDTLLIVFVLPLMLYGCGLAFKRATEMQTWEERQQVKVEECREMEGNPVLWQNKQFKECILPSE